MAPERSTAYNPVMATRAEREIDNWLRDGGLVLAASDRATRSLERAYHQRRLNEGLSAWAAPRIQGWAAFVRAAWEERASDERMLLTPAQEQAVWADIIGREEHVATVLEGPRHRLASLAMQAHDLLCSYSARYLKATARNGWDRDAGTFSNWLSAFNRACERDNLLSPSRASWEVTKKLETDPAQRLPLLLIGFDRLLPAQRECVDAWGGWRAPEVSDQARKVQFYSAPDRAAELAACVSWSEQQLAANPQARLLVICQEIASRRGEMERALLRLSAPDPSPLFDFSLGIPLSQVPLAHAAQLVLRWLDGALLEHEVDWLLSTGLTCVDRMEETALQSYMRNLRRRGLARTDWTLDAFASQSAVFERDLGGWYRRMNSARGLLARVRKRRASPFEWAAMVPRLLEAAGLPGQRRLASAEFQAWRRWEQVIDTCGGLGFDGRRVSWADFFNVLSRALDETLYTPESSDASIQIAGPAESAGLTADAIWFLGADGDSWPSTGAAHPFLPLHVQREAGMPHASVRSDWELAESITKRLIASAPDVRFSYAALREQTETSASRIVAHVVGDPEPLSPGLAAPPLLLATVTSSDASRVPFPSSAALGGSNLLSWQSQCPFKAFAAVRLGAQGWEPAEFGLTPAQRGQLLHDVLHSVWGGPPDGLRSLGDLRALPELESFVATHVQKVLGDQTLSAIYDRLPERYLALEQTRLIRLVKSWLEFECTRIPFAVVETEVERTIDIEALSLKLRLDRVDRLIDDSLLVIDYKTGDVTRKVWELPRPDDVQLPLYAALGLSEKPGGLVFAKVRPGETRFIGHVRDAGATLFAGIKRADPLLKHRLTDELMQAWAKCIEKLARDFLSGLAQVDPREYPATCDRCGLHAVCRIREHQTIPDLELGNDDGADE
jgi:probable DNA repair protein